MNRISELVKSFLAGLAISIGGMIFLACENKIVGACMFAIGLISVVLFGWNLYTGRIGYVLDQSKTFFLDTVLSVFGNCIGCLVAGVVRSPIGSVATVCENKLAKPLPTVLVDAIFCGLLIFICVDIFKKKNTLVGIFFCIPVFILCGFEHSVADMFYLFNARVFSWEAVLFIAVVVVGNAIGGLFIPVCNKVIAATGKPKQE